MANHGNLSRSAMTLVLSCLVFGLYSCTSGNQPPHRLFRIGTAIPIERKDPFDIWAMDEFEVFAAIHDTLIKYDAKEGYHPQISDRWSHDPQSRRWTFHIKEGLQFSDGTPLDAHSVAFSLKRIIFLDKAQDQTLTRCLEGKFDLSSPNADFPPVKVNGSNEVSIGPVNCGESFLNAFAGANYGIVSKNTLDFRYKISDFSIVSGMYIPNWDEGGLTLSPNPKNFRNKDTSPLPSLKFGRLDASDPNQWKTYDSFKVSRSARLKDVRAENFSTAQSLPVMTWYLTPVHDPKNWTETKKLISQINDNLNRDWNYFKANTLETPANQFFPGDFNCGPGDSTSGLQDKNPVKFSHRNMEIVTHPSGEADDFLPELIESLKKINVNAVIVEASTPAKANRSRFRFNRLYLSDSLSTILSNLFFEFRSIPDPDNTMKPRVQEYASKPRDHASIVESELCRRFHHFNHIPIAHRRIGFASRHQETLPLFSTANGNLDFDRLRSPKRRQD
jgi:hypothetical protein